MGAFLKICDFVFVLRPLVLIPAWSFYLIGAAQGGNGALTARFALNSPNALISLTSMLVSAYLLNQIFDRESDEKNDKCFYLSRGIFSVRTLVVLSGIFFFVASFAFQRVESDQRILLLVALSLSLLYSLPPARLCARPFADTAANAIGYGGIAYAIGFTTRDPSTADAITSSIPDVLVVASTFLHTTILDVSGDRASGKISTAVFIGERRAAVLAAGLHGLAVLSAIVTGTALALIVTVAPLPLTVLATARPSRATSSLLVQATTLVVALTAAFLWPLYIAVLLPIVAVARVYYRKRFGIIYPGLAKSA